MGIIKKDKGSQKPGGRGHVVSGEFIDESAEVPDGALDPFNDRVEEILAKCAHDMWSHWMRYMMKPVIIKIDVDGQERTVTLQRAVVEGDRWRRQMETAYKNLSEPEKEADRECADMFIRPALKKILAPPRILL